jgi:hypothetical protein
MNYSYYCGLPNGMNVKKFILNRNEIEAFRKKAVRRGFVISCLLSLAGAGIGWFNTMDKGDSLSPLFALIPVPLIFSVSMIGNYRGIKRRMELLKSYTIAFDSVCIYREQKDTPDAEIFKGHLVEISRNRAGGFIIRGKHRDDLIMVPMKTENEEEFLHTLEQIMPITGQQPNLPAQRRQLLVIVLSIGSMIVFYVSQNKVVFTFSGLVFMSILVYSFISIRRNQQIDSRTKRLGWWLIYLLAISVFMMVMRWTG